MIQQLKQFQSKRKQYANLAELSVDLRTNQALKQEIEHLYKAFYHQTVHGCNNCYMDAYVQLMNLNIDDAMKKLDCQFRLRAGALLQDFDDSSKLCSQANITRELALHHLAKNPGCNHLFAILPDNWEQQVADYQEKQSQLAN
ncbi:MAG: hypothetical protein P4L28_12060 [Paludibacteraceae bacterium]|nr:hypothetical protein [Paludibacteraceae bacterium]